MGANKTTLISSAEFPFICEVAMADGSYCPVCQNPDTDYKPMTHYGSSSIALGGPLDSPLRVSADKCVYLFKKQGTKADNMGSCSSMGLQPLKLLQVYENNLVKTSLKHFGNKYVWTDLIMRNKSNLFLILMMHKPKLLVFSRIYMGRRGLGLSRHCKSLGRPIF